MLLPAETLRERVSELAGEIDRHYEGREVLIVVVLKGAFVFAGDLIRCLQTPVRIDFIRLDSYGENTFSNHGVRVNSDLAEPVEGREVLIVEDIIDSGCCMEFLTGHLRERGAQDVKICALLDKPSRREVEIEPDFVGFVIPDVFVVGYGLDHAQRLRNLPDLCFLEDQGSF